MSTVVDNFNNAVAGYEAHSQPQALLAATLAAMIPPCERKGRAVEFGAGTGLFTQHMTPWGDGEYLATDAAPNMVARGRARCPHAHWELRDARENTGSGAFDWVLACNLLQWLEEPENILRGWRKLLRPGGQLAVAILTDGTLKELREALPEASAQVRWRSEQQWRDLLVQAGFQIQQTLEWAHLSQYPRALDLLRELHAAGLAPQRKVAPARLLSALRVYDTRFAGTGGVRASWSGWLARATAVA